MSIISGRVQQKTIKEKKRGRDIATDENFNAYNQFQTGQHLEPRNNIQIPQHFNGVNFSCFSHEKFQLFNKFLF